MGASFAHYLIPQAYFFWFASIFWIICVTPAAMGPLGSNRRYSWNSFMAPKGSCLRRAMFPRTTCTGAMFGSSAAAFWACGSPTVKEARYATGSNAGVVLNLFLGPTKGPGFSGTLAQGVGGDLGAPAGMTMDSLLVLLRNGHAYVNVHTPAHPAGEIRGQLVKQ